MNDYVVSMIRTYVPLAVGAALVWLAQAIGPLDIDTTAVQTGAVLIVSGLWYALVRAAEQRWPSLGWLLGSARQPSY